MRNRNLLITAALAASLTMVPATAAAEDPRWPDPTGATMFSGSLAEGAKLLEDVQNEAGLIIGGFEEAEWLEMSDSRLDGTVTIATSATDGGLGPTQDSDVITDAIHIQMPDGAWNGRPSTWFWLEDDTISNRVHVLVGDGAYDGLIALMEVSGDLSWTGPIDVRGIVFEGSLPEPPAHPVTDWR